MPPQIACAALYYWSAICIILNATPPGIIVGATSVVGVGVRTASIISISSWRGAVGIVRRLLSEEYLLRCPCF